MTWIVAQTKPRLELLACEHLNRQQVANYCPHFQDRTTGEPRPLFPSYVFVDRPSPREENLVWLSSTRGISKVLKSGDDIPLLGQRIIDALVSSHDESGYVRLGPRNMVHEELYRRGDTVRLKVTPFAGHLGIYDGLNAPGRVRVLMALLGGAPVICCCDSIELVAHGAVA